MLAARGKRSPEKIEERIQRGQERRAACANSSAKSARVEPPQQAETSTEPGEPVVLTPAPAAAEPAGSPAEERSEVSESESSSSSSVSTIDYETGSLPVQTEAAASAAAERIRAIKLEGDPGEPEGPHAPSAGVKSEDPNEEPLASAAAKAASELRDSWISVKEEVDYSPSDTPGAGSTAAAEAAEPSPEAGSPAAAEAAVQSSWVEVQETADSLAGSTIPSPRLSEDGDGGDDTTHR